MAEAVVVFNTSDDLKNIAILQQANQINTSNLETKTYLYYC